MMLFIETRKLFLIDWNLNFLNRFDFGLWQLYAGCRNMMNFEVDLYRTDDALVATYRSYI